MTQYFSFLYKINHLCVLFCDTSIYVYLFSVCVRIIQIDSASQVLSTGSLKKEVRKIQHFVKTYNCSQKVKR